MYKSPVFNYSTFKELPFEKLNHQKFLIYVLDFNWNYLFVNAAACQLLNKRPEELIGKNMWELYKELLADPNFVNLKRATEDRRVFNATTTSPVTGERISITGHPLDDCYYFSVSVLPKKDILIDDLRNELKKQQQK